MATMSSTLSPPSSRRCSNGILTFFNPTEANLQRLDTFCSEETNYAVYGEAVCQHTKLPLIHVVFKLKQRCSISTVQKILGDGKQCGFRSFLEMGVLGDPESSKFAPKYAKKGDQTEIEWETHGDNGPNFGLNYKGKEFHEWFSKGARHDLVKRKEEVAGEGTAAAVAAAEAEEAVANESMEVEGVEAGDGGEVPVGEVRGGGGDDVAAVVPSPVADFISDAVPVAVAADVVDDVVDEVEADDVVDEAYEVHEAPPPPLLPPLLPPSPPSPLPALPPPPSPPPPACWAPVCSICLSVSSESGDVWLEPAVSFGCSCVALFHLECLQEWYKVTTGIRRRGEIGRLAQSFRGVVACPCCRASLSVPGM
jgi:hypothetical protein